MSQPRPRWPSTSIAANFLPGRSVDRKLIFPRTATFVGTGREFNLLAGDIGLNIMAMARLERISFRYSGFFVNSRDTAHRRSRYSHVQLALGRGPLIGARLKTVGVILPVE